jgi:disulfide bond formation protein DsbB
MKRDAVFAISYAGVVGQVLIVLMLVIGVLALVGVRGPLNAVRRWLWGYELWAGFIVASIATGGSLYYSLVMQYQPCELCWYQRICMYPLSILLLLMALRADNRAARYLFPLPIVGAGVSIYHMLIQYHAITEPNACQLSAPGSGCSFNWIGTPALDASLGYLAIPTLALTGFLLLIGFLVLATAETADAATLPADAER